MWRKTIDPKKLCAVDNAHKCGKSREHFGGVQDSDPGATWQEESDPAK
jgi:hypothetical protein